MNARLAVAMVALGLGAAPAAAQVVLVEQNTAATYLTNNTDPMLGLGWTDPAFDDTAWSAGSYGVGFEAGTGAENLSQTAVPSGTKPTAGLRPHEGAVYAVAGSSGRAGGGSFDHPAMVVAFSRLGSMVLEFHGDRLDAAFVSDTGSVDDRFTILKGPDVAPADPAPLVVAGVTDVTVDLMCADAGADEDGYRLWRSLDGVNWTEVAVLAADVVTHTDTGLTPGTRYWYRVEAFAADNGCGFGPRRAATGCWPAVPTTRHKTRRSGSRSSLFAYI